MAYKVMYDAFPGLYPYGPSNDIGSKNTSFLS
jgi:hypothetical protein